MVESEPRAFNCDECELRQWQAELDADNRRAWDVFQRCANRFCRETQTSALVLERLTADDEVEEFADLMERLSLLNDVILPPRRSEDSR